MDTLTALFRLTFVVVLAGLFSAPMANAGDGPPAEERLVFQSFAPWSPRTNIEADVAIVYGIDPSLPERIAKWRARGYGIHVMTGVSWGKYGDYLEGRYDGQKHADEAQMDRDGKVVIHGGDIPYLSPSAAYGGFLCRGVQRALDAGATAIHLEEPEFWVRSGYEENFKREWQAQYGEPWQPPHSSPDAQYRASKLKYLLYRRALSQVFDFVHDYSKKAGREVRCYVATHSLLNYAQWKIVSPESSLLGVGCDGYIAQVWTGTARTPNIYEAIEKSRTFETAFLEYGAMQNLVRASGRRVWYLNDPVEDNPNHSWEDYRRNWESTLTASLLQPEVWRYEIMPWPDRVFSGKYFQTEADAKENKPRVTIPADYASELQAVIHALGEMKQPDTHWESRGTRGVGVLVSDTMMFQRGEPNPSDKRLGSFYGLALPLIERGVPVEPVQIESATTPGFLDGYRMLFLTYEGQKPPTPAFHEALAAWVKRGGALIVVDDDKDPYNAVREWWNTGSNVFRCPREHLFKMLGLDAGAEGVQSVGDGMVLRKSVSPASLAYRKDGGDEIEQMALSATEALKSSWSETDSLVLRRGPYVIAAGLDDAAVGSPTTVAGHFVDLFDGQLPIVNDVLLTPGRRALLLDVDAAKKIGAGPRVIAAACRVRDAVVEADRLTFRAEGVANTNGVALLVCPHAPKGIRINDEPAPAGASDFHEGILRVRFPNSPDGTKIEADFPD